MAHLGHFRGLGELAFGITGRLDLASHLSRSRGAPEGAADAIDWWGFWPQAAKMVAASESASAAQERPQRSFTTGRLKSARLSRPGRRLHAGGRFSGL